MTFRVKLRVIARKKPKTFWLNVYQPRRGYFQAGGMYANRRNADAVAKPHRYACIPVDVPITVFNGG